MPIEFDIQAPNIRPEGFRPAAVQAMRDSGHDFIKSLVVQNLSGQHGDTGLNRRSGNLAGGFNAATTETTEGADLSVWVTGPAKAYARIQEFGGVIKPINGKYLWIPIAGNVDPTGNARIKPSEAIDAGGFIDWRGPIFFGKNGKRGLNAVGGIRSITPLFVLKRSVTLKPRMGASPLFRQKMDELGKRLGEIAMKMAA